MVSHPDLPVSPRRRKDRHEASGFSRRPDPDSDEDEDYERERRKRSKGTANGFGMERGEKEGGGFAVLFHGFSISLSSREFTVNSEPLE